MTWTHLIDMELSDDDILDMPTPYSVESKPSYPFGLRICLTNTELEKLKLDSDCEIGDYLDMRAFGCVTSVSKTDGPDGPSCRIEIQIERIALEDEMSETPGG